MNLISTNRVKAKVPKPDEGPKTIVISSAGSIVKDKPNVIVAKPHQIFTEPDQLKPGAGPFITVQNMGQFRKTAQQKRQANVAAEKPRAKRTRKKRAAKKK